MLEGARNDGAPLEMGRRLAVGAYHYMGEQAGNTGAGMLGKDVWMETRP